MHDISVPTNYTSKGYFIFCNTHKRIYIDSSDLVTLPTVFTAGPYRWSSGCWILHTVTNILHIYYKYSLTENATILTVQKHWEKVNRSIMEVEILTVCLGLSSSPSSEDETHHSRHSYTAAPAYYETHRYLDLLITEYISIQKFGLC